jgi:PAS domain S-box-containing protein
MFSSYRFQFSLILLTGSALLLGILATIFHYIGTIEVNERFKEAALFNAQMIDKQFQNDTQTMSLTVQSLSQCDSLIELITAENEDEALYKLKYAHSSFLLMMRKQPTFMQLRYINAQGEEVIRFDRKHSSEEPYKIPKEQLQNKDHRDYFIETAKLPAGQVWFSKLDLNIEHGKIEMPVKPTLRVSTPVYIDGSFRGIVIVNALMNEVLDNIRQSMEGLQVAIVDKDGEYLIHPNSQYNWSKYLKHGHNLKDDFHQEREILNNEQFISTKFLTRRLGLDNGENLILIIEMDRHFYKKRFDYVNKVTFIVITVMFFIFLLANIFTFRLMASVPERLKKAVEERTQQLTDKQNELQNQLEFQKTLLETIPNPLFIKDKQGVYQECNSAFESYLDIKKEALIGHTQSELMPMPKVSLDADLKLKDNRVLTYEAKVHHADGSERNIIFNEALIPGEMGGTIGVMVDVTQLKAVQDKLAESYANSEKMVTLGQLIAGVAHEINTPLGAIRSSVDGIAQFLTKNLEQLPDCFDLLSKTQRQDFFALLQKANQQETTLSTKEKRQYRHALTHQLDDTIEDAMMVADTLVDMGIYEEIEAFLPLLKDSNSPSILKTAYQLAILQKGIKTIEVASKRANKVALALINFARYDHTGKKVKAIITDGIETVLILYHNQLKQGVEVVKNYAELPAVFCYPDELNQVWTNLIHNALQAMDNHGTLQIEVFMQNNHAVINISDSGKGIPDDIKPNIFKQFFTTKPAGEGTGLGLDIVKKIIDKHKGTIAVESVPGRTTFMVALPV